MFNYIYVRKVFREFFRNSVTLRDFRLNVILLCSPITFNVTGFYNQLDDSQNPEPRRVPQVPGQSMSPFSIAARIAAFNPSSSMDAAGQKLLSAPTQSSKKSL